MGFEDGYWVWEEGIFEMMRKLLGFEKKYSWIEGNVLVFLGM